MTRWTIRPDSPTHSRGAGQAGSRSERGVAGATQGAWACAGRLLREVPEPIEKLHEETMAHDNATALGDAKKAIESERKQH